MNALGTNCSACGKERKQRSLRYDPNSLKGYCHTSYLCNEEHPNAPVNLIRNGREVPLVTYEEALEAHKRNLLKSFDSASVEKIQRLVQKPTSIRITDPEMAQFIVEIEERMGLESISDAIRFMIQLVQENDGILYAETKRLKEKKQAEEATETAIQEIEKESASALEPEKPAKVEEELTF